MLDLKTDTEEKFQVRNNILEDQEHVYIANWKRKRIIWKVTMALPNV